MLNSSTDVTWELVGSALSGPAPDLQNQNLHFNQSPGDARAHYTLRSKSILSNRAKGANELQGDARAH